MKSYTDLDQSRKLAKILPIESADMCYRTTINRIAIVSDIPTIGKRITEWDIPCWSLASLLGVLPKIGAEEPMIRKLYYASEPKERYIGEYSIANITSEYDNPVDACVAMVEKLHGLNLL